MTGVLPLRRLFQASFFSFALFVPFSIAGMNFAFGFGMLAWVTSWVVFRGASTQPFGERASIRQDPLFLASILLVASALPSVLISEDASRATRDWSSYWELMIYFLVAANILAVKMREVAFWTLVASATLSCFVALVQRAGGMDLWFIHIPAQYRMGSTLYTMTFAGILYQLILLSSAILLTRGMAARTRLLLGAATAIQFVTISLWRRRRPPQ